MTSPLKPAPNAVLLLADGTVFFGMGIGAEGATSGEICFNTAMTGYQEILTDPSYTGQIITFTFPHIGNVGCNGEDVESTRSYSPLAGESNRDSDSVRGQEHSNHPLTDSASLHLQNPAPPQGGSKAILHGATGLILREPITEPSNFRAEESLDAWLIARGITGISGIDTRALTRHIRMHGAQNGAIVYVAEFGIQDSGFREKLVKKAKAALVQAPDMNGLELAAHVTTKTNYEWAQERWALGTVRSQTPYSPLEGESTRVSAAVGGNVAKNTHPGTAKAVPAPPQVGGWKKPHVVAIDYGVKLNILRSLVSVGCRVTVVPATTTAEEILALNPDGVFLSNGPGDPAATGSYAVPVIKKIVHSGIPTFGICLGHQMLGIALGSKTEKMRQGHRGANHPVKDLKTGKVEITSQNHGFAISDVGLPADVEVTHRSLFDGTIQGIAMKDKPVFSVQGHPEASPGPHDSQYLFERFVELMTGDKRRVA